MRYGSSYLQRPNLTFSRSFNKDHGERKIVTIPSYDQGIVAQAQKFNLTLVDLDGVVLNPAHTYLRMANNENYNSLQYTYLLNAGNSHEEIMTYYYEMSAATRYTPMSTQLIEFLSNIAQQNMVLGFTARSPHFAPESIEHINSVGMQFSNIPQLQNYSRLKSGVVFMGASPSASETSPSKGDAILDLIAYFRMNRISLDSVFVIDDSRKNLECVEASLSAQEPHITFLGVHYTEADENLRRTFTEEEARNIANRQYFTFKSQRVLLSDEEANRDIDPVTSETPGAETSTNNKAAGDGNNDDETVIYENTNHDSKGGNKTFISIITNFSISVESTIDSHHGYDETNSAEVLALLRTVSKRHYEETYGDLKCNFDKGPEEFQLKTESSHTKEEIYETSYTEYVPDWLESLFIGQKDPGITTEFEHDSRIDLTQYTMGGMVLPGSHALPDDILEVGRNAIMA